MDLIPKNCVCTFVPNSRQLLVKAQRSSMQAQHTRAWPRSGSTSGRRVPRDCSGRELQYRRRDGIAHRVAAVRLAVVGGGGRRGAQVRRSRVEVPAKALGHRGADVGGTRRADPRFAHRTTNRAPSTLGLEHTGLLSADFPPPSSPPRIPLRFPRVTDSADTGPSASAHIRLRGRDTDPQPWHMAADQTKAWHGCDGADPLEIRWRILCPQSTKFYGPDPPPHPLSPAPSRTRCSAGCRAADSGGIPVVQPVLRRI